MSVRLTINCTTGERIEAESKPSRERLQAWRLDALACVRAERNARLSKTDWVHLPDSPISSDELEMWNEYRQALRDVPANHDPALGLDVDWPVPPSLS